VTLVAAEELPYLHAIEKSINIRMGDGRAA
jgi:hypothetical protein